MNYVHTYRNSEVYEAIVCCIVCHFRELIFHKFEISHKFVNKLMPYINYECLQKVELDK